MTWEHMPEFLKRLTVAVDGYERDTVAGKVTRLIADTRESDEPCPAGDAARVMRLLRKKRWFDLMESAGDAFIQSGVLEPEVRRNYAQALLDQGKLSAGEAMLLVLAQDTATNPTEHAEAVGLLGRTYKQMYVDAARPDVARNRRLLVKSADAYYRVFREDPSRHAWQGINTVALLKRAERDGVAMYGYPDPDDLAGAILAEIKGRHADGAATTWDYGTALEACIALGKMKKAQEWLKRYIASEHADSFELSSTLRQFEEVWQLEPDGEAGIILTTLRARILDREDGGQVTFHPQVRAKDEANIDAVPDVQLEKILGTTGVKSLQWYRTGLTRANAIVLISDLDGRGTGTGFLVTGADLCEHLPSDEVFVLTNAHVVAEEHVVTGTLYPEDATVRFEALGLDETFQVTELLWTSPPAELDASLLRLDKPCPKVESIPFSKRLPLIDGQQRLYVIGHPLGGGLSFSLQDNVLLDHEAPKLHYRTPTEPGSSGSPVFDAKWRLVGLHHAGSPNMPRLHKQGGTYAANEGLWIQSIREQMAADLDGFGATAVSLDGIEIATALPERVMAQTVDGADFAELKVAIKGVYSVAYAPDRSHLAAVGADGRLRVWPRLGP